MRHRPDRLFLLTGGTQGLALAWGLPAVVWWVVELALSPIQLVLLGTALVVTILVAEVPTGVIADLYSRKRSVVAAYTVMGVAMTLAPVTELFGVLLVWQVLWGIGWTLQSGAATAWMTDELALAARTHRIGALPPVPPGGEQHETEPVAAEDADSDDGENQTAGAADRLIVHHAIWRSVGVMVGLVAAAALGTWSVRGSMAVMGGLTLGIAAFLATTMTEAGFEPSRDRNAAGAPNVRRVGPWRDAADLWKQGARLVRRRPTLLAVVIAAAVAGAASEAIERLDTLRLVQLGLTDYDANEAVVWFGAVWFVMAALAIPLMGWLARHIGQRHMGCRQSQHRDRHREVLLLACLLVIAGIGAMALAVSPWFAVALGGWTVLDVAGETTYPLAEAMANRDAPSAVRATVISFLGQAEAVGEVLGGLILGAVAQLVSVPAALVAAAVLFALSAAPVALVSRRANGAEG